MEQVRLLGLKEKMSDIKMETYNREAPMYSGIIPDTIYGVLLYLVSPP